jgi:hypothetical protein
VSDVAAAVGVAFARREVAGQAVGVEVVGQLRHHALPEPGVAQAHGLAGLLLEADEGVVGEPVAHAGQALGQPRLQRELEAAPARQRAGRRRHVEIERAIDLHQRGLLHRQRHGGHDALPGLERVLRATQRVLGLDLPQDGLGARLRELRGRGHRPGDLARLTGRDVHRLRRSSSSSVARGDDGHLHRLLRGVAQGELRAELVVLAHQRRQAADDLQVLRGAHAGLPGAELRPVPRVGHGDDPEGGERVVERHRDDGLALRRPA